MQNKTLTVHSIETMDYSSFVGLVRERNRPSGGIASVTAVASVAGVNAKTKFLEIGCNTGFTTANMAALTGCSALGIDVNNDSIAEARRYSNSIGVSHLAKYKKMNAVSLGLPNSKYDLVWCSNVTSFISKKEQAIKEYLRVLKFNGTLAAIPIYYRKTPPASIVEKVSLAIGNKITVTQKDQWLKLFETAGDTFGNSLFKYYTRDFEYLDRSAQIPAWCDWVCDKPHLAVLEKPLRIAIRKKLEWFMNLFNENLQYCGFSIILFQKRISHEEPELFLTKETTDA